jgi:hypothetical protein
MTETKTNAMKRLAEALPLARALGPTDCNRFAEGKAVRGDLKGALIWYAAACLVQYDEATGERPSRRCASDIEAPDARHRPGRGPTTPEAREAVRALLGLLDEADDGSKPLTPAERRQIAEGLDCLGYGRCTRCLAGKPAHQPCGECGADAYGLGGGPDVPAGGAS